MPRRRFSQKALLARLIFERQVICKKFPFFANLGELDNLGLHPTTEKAVAYGQFRLIENLLYSIETAALTLPKENPNEE